MNVPSYLASFNIWFNPFKQFSAAYNFIDWGRWIEKLVPHSGEESVGLLWLTVVGRVDGLSAYIAKLIGAVTGDMIASLIFLDYHVAVGTFSESMFFLNEFGHFAITSSFVLDL